MAGYIYRKMTALQRPQPQSRHQRNSDFKLSINLYSLIHLLSSTFERQVAHYHFYYQEAAMKLHFLIGQKPLIFLLFSSFSLNKGGQSFLEWPRLRLISVFYLYGNYSLLLYGMLYLIHGRLTIVFFRGVIHSRLISNFYIPLFYHLKTVNLKSLPIIFAVKLCKQVFLSAL